MKTILAAVDSSARAPMVVAAVYRWRAGHPHPALWDDWAAVAIGKPALGTLAFLLIGSMLIAVGVRRETARRQQDLQRRSAEVL